MTHPDPETLALIALGETGSDREALHLAGCADCRDAVARFARPVAAARAAEPALQEPHPRVWDGIASELGLDAPTGRVARVDGPARSAPPRGRRAAVLALAAAAAVAVAIAGVTAGVVAARDRPRQLATAQLAALPGWGAISGTATLERLPDGHRVVEIRADLPTSATTDHEVWLMTSAVTHPIPLGTLTGTHGTFAAPSGVDLRRFRLVDISNEPRDGVRAHSGDSMVRGTLRS